MDRLLAGARNDKPSTPLQSKINEKFNLNLSGTAPKLRGALGGVAEAIPAIQPASQKAVGISTNLHIRSERLREVVRTFDRLAVLLPLFILATLLSALALARRRRQLGFTIVVIVVVLMLCELVSVKWLRQQTLSQVRHGEYLAAVGFVFDSVVSWLKQMMYIVLAGMAAIFGLLLLGGPSKWEGSVRSLLHLDQLRRSRFGDVWRSVRAWCGKRQYFLWLGAVLVVLAGMTLFGAVTTQTVVNALLLAISLIALVHIIATPRHQVSL
jgi:hypothetical protein